ncbi:hypothetical protein SAMN05444156_1391 [Verrucomicrobium sp. GAS474]|uniref:hypothetical protein n=1 Tax=Verrucomicrobium sp. GAS474 TaxID=1882831 RepID=UPI000879B1C0|nr:hypothetical protein [Verrucomicrobium sp. GAS474]SDU00523.1 hypothetical protein SAMN05444156_1391 [Verrucomicrobium sp. GAS474]
MIPFLAESCCDVVASSYPITKTAVWITAGIAGLVLALGIVMGLLIAKKRGQAKG